MGSPYAPLSLFGYWRVQGSFSLGRTSELT